MSSLKAIRIMDSLNIVFGTGKFKRIFFSTICDIWDNGWRLGQTFHYWNFETLLVPCSCSKECSLIAESVLKTVTFSFPFKGCQEYPGVGLILIFNFNKWNWRPELPLTVSGPGCSNDIWFWNLWSDEMWMFWHFGIYWWVMVIGPIIRKIH